MFRFTSRDLLWLTATTAIIIIWSGGRLIREKVTQYRASRNYAKAIQEIQELKKSFAFAKNQYKKEMVAAAKVSQEFDKMRLALKSSIGDQRDWFTLEEQHGRIFAIQRIGDRAQPTWEQLQLIDSQTPKDISLPIEGSIRGVLHAHKQQFIREAIGGIDATMNFQRVPFAETKFEVDWNCWIQKTAAATALHRCILQSPEFETFGPILIELSVNGKVFRNFKPIKDFKQTTGLVAFNLWSVPFSTEMTFGLPEAPEIVISKFEPIRHGDKLP